MSAPSALHVNDVIYVKITEGKKQSDAKAELRIRPKVQGAALVLENKTGRILAMVGGFSYPLSQLNRTSQALRQPGSSIKPLTYLAALHSGLQPNTLVLDAPVTLPPIPGVTTHYLDAEELRRLELGLDHAAPRAGEFQEPRHRAPARRRHRQGPDARACEQICDLALQAKIYPECMKNYPFVLGAQSLRMIDLAAFYAAIVNEGLRVTPYAINSIEQNGHAVYKHQAGAPVMMAGGDRAAFYQLRTILEGVVARGTAASLRHLTHFVGGKTGTTDNENDAWFVGFTSDVTVAVWVGYDNARGKQHARPRLDRRPHRRSDRRADHPGDLESGHAPKTPLPPPSAEAARHLKALPIDLRQRATARRRQPSGFTEYFKLDANKKLRDTQYSLAGRNSLARGEPPPAGGASARSGANAIEERPQHAPPSAGGPAAAVRIACRETCGSCSVL